MKSLKEWRKKLDELATTELGQEIASKPPEGSARSSPLQQDKDMREREVVGRLDYMKRVFASTRGRADPEILGDIKTRVLQAKEAFARDVAPGENKRWEQLSLLDQYDFLMHILQTVLAITMPRDVSSGGKYTWTQTGLNKLRTGAESEARERNTVPSKAPDAMEPLNVSAEEKPNRAAR